MGAGFVHLHVHGPFSFLDGASPTEALVERAARLGMSALALTDHDSLSGVVRFVQAARQAGIKPIVGAELTMEGGFHLTLLAANRTGYRHLCQLITRAHLGSPRRQPRLAWAELAGRSEGLIALSGCCRGEAAAALWRQDEETARRSLLRLRDLFGGRLYVELVQPLWPGSRKVVAGLARLARELGLPVVATNDVHFARKEDFPLHDLLTCVRTLTRVDELHPQRPLNGENYLKSAQEMAELFGEYPQALEHTLRIAEACEDQVVPLGEKLLPSYPVPPGWSSMAWLRELTYRGAQERYGRLRRKLQERLEHELAVIEALGVADYFLVVWDIVQWARRQGIRMAGRGSAADSAVAYCLGITEVDAVERGLMFERFLSLERAQAPDIDIDFDWRRRDEVVEYVFRRFGEEHVAAVATYNTFRARSAVRDLGKALGLEPNHLDELARRLPHIPADAIHHVLQQLPELRESALVQGPGKERFRLLFQMAEAVAGLPRHLSTHLGGLILSREPIAHLVPLQRAAKGVVVAQFDKDDVEAMGFIKLDLLSLRTLGAVEDTVRLIQASPGQQDFRYEAIPLDDPDTYGMLRRGETVGVFQLESPAQRALQSRLGAEQLEDLVASVALIRPGPIKGNMVEPFIARRRGQQPVEYLHPALERILKKTYGVVLYQEQVIEIATEVAGFTPGEADRLRRTMTHHRSQKEMEAIGELFVARAIQRGVDPQTARAIFACIEGYAGYGFCEAHAAAFATTAYKTAYLLRHYPAQFFAALLNNQPMGFYPPHTLVGEARRRGVVVEGPDVNASQEGYTVVMRADGPPVIRTPLWVVREVGREGAAAILQERRRHGPFRSLWDLCRRVPLPVDAWEGLILAGALDSLHPNRRALLWDLPALMRAARSGSPLQAAPLSVEEQAPHGLYGGACGQEQVARVPDFPPWQRVCLEFYAMGFSPGHHLLEFLRPSLARQGVLPVAQARRCRDGERVQVAGLVIRPHRPPTRSGRTVVFFTLEDETGLLDVTVFEAIYQRWGQPLFTRPAVVVTGRIQHQGSDGRALIAQAVRPLSLSEPKTA